jgi:DNA-binding XRE family transcriptional regulator
LSKILVSTGIRVAKRRGEAPTPGESPITPKKRKRRPRPQDLDILAENVRAFRRAAGWAQEVLAQEADLERSHVGAIEQRKFDVRLSTLGALAKAFKCRTADLLLPRVPTRSKKVK